MKNYELMKLLGDMPAGAEVKINVLLSTEELGACDEVDVNNRGENVHSYSAEIEDLDTDRDKTIYLYI
ncbi:hypothetical protein [Emergencia sp.]|uniref:hypothetical protein n=1 Tax=Emergencia sp. TaxID=1926557 RepID=UPI003AF0938D